MAEVILLAMRDDVLITEGEEDVVYTTAERSSRLT